MENFKDNFSTRNDLSATLILISCQLVWSYNCPLQEEYDKLVERLEGYPAELLDHIHSDEEVTHVVNRGTKTLFHTSKDKPPRELARIELAMHFDQKKVQFS